MPEPENDDGTFTLLQLQKAVGGYVEQIMPHTSNDAPSGSVFLCDEEGLLKEKPYNALASALVGRNIVGDLVVMNDSHWS
jgi:hypothetical protein